MVAEYARCYLARAVWFGLLMIGLLACSTVLTPYGQAETVLIVTDVEDVIASVDDLRAFGAGLSATEALSAGDSLVFVWNEFTLQSDVSFVVFIDENGSNSCEATEPAWGVLVDVAEGLDSEVFRGELGEQVQCGEEEGDEPGEDDSRDGDDG